MSQPDPDTRAGSGAHQWLSAFLLIVIGGVALWWALPGLRSEGTANGDADRPTVDGLPQPSLTAARGTEAPAAAPQPAADAGANAQRGVRGVVVDAETGAPIAGARVCLHCPNDRFLPSSRGVLTREDGSFDLDAQGPFSSGEPLGLLAHTDGYLPATAPADGRGRIELRLKRGAAIAGVVETPWGEPVAGARVIARSPWNRVGWPTTDRHVITASSPGTQTTTDARGAFELTGLSEGVQYDVLAQKPGFGHAGLSYERVAAPSEALKLVLHLEASVVFRDSRNDRRSADRLHWMASMMFSEHPRLNSIGTSYWRGGRLGEERFLVRGKAHIGEEIELPYYVLTHDRGIVRGKAIARVGERVVHELPLAETPGSVPVRLRATHGDGRPFEGWLGVQLSQADGEGSSCARVQFKAGSAAEPMHLPVGRYVLYGLSGGDVESGFWTPFGKKEIDVTGAGEFDLQLVGVPCGLRVHDATGRAVRGYSIRVQKAGGEASGWFPDRLADAPDAGVDAARIWLAPGQYTVSATLPHMGSGATTVEVKVDGGEPAIVITLDPKREIDFWALAQRAKARRLAR